MLTPNKHTFHQSRHLFYSLSLSLSPIYQMKTVLKMTKMYFLLVHAAYLANQNIFITSQKWNTPYLKWNLYMFQLPATKIPCETVPPRNYSNRLTANLAGGKQFTRLPASVNNGSLSRSIGTNTVHNDLVEISKPEDWLKVVGSTADQYYITMPRYCANSICGEQDIFLTNYIVSVGKISSVPAFLGACVESGVPSSVVARQKWHAFCASYSSKPNQISCPRFLFGTSIFQSSSCLTEFLPIPSVSTI